GSFDAGKIDTKLRRDTSRDWRCFHTRFVRSTTGSRFSWFLFFCGRSRFDRFLLFLRWRGFLFFLFGRRRFFCFLFRLFLFLLRFRLLFFLRLLFFFCRLFFLRRFLALPADERDFVADVHFPAFLDVNFSKRSVFRRFPFHRRLVGLDLGNHVTRRNFVAFLFFP